MQTDQQGSPAIWNQWWHNVTHHPTHCKCQAGWYWTWFTYPRGV